ncbi:caspase family protein [Flaviaesturariibacter terrae]
MQAKAFSIALLGVLLLARTTATAQQTVALPAGIKADDHNLSTRLSPDGRKLLLAQSDRSTRLYFYNIAPLVVADSAVVSGTWGQPAWNGAGTRLLLYGRDYEPDSREQLLLLSDRGQELKRIDLPLSDSFPDLRYKLLNYTVDSAGHEASAVLYCLPETGAQYEFELNSVVAEPKAYHFQVARIDLESGRVLARIPVAATYLSCAGYRQGKPLLLKGSMPEKYQSTLDLFTVDFASGKLHSLGAETLLRNQTLERVSVFSAAHLYLEVERGLYRYDEGAGFRQIFYQALVHSKVLRVSVQGDRLLLLGEAQRTAENELWVLNADGAVQQHNDLRDAVPTMAFRLRDTVRSLLIDDRGITVRAHPAEATADNRKMRVQLPFAADERLRIPGTPYLLEYNSSEWQVIDVEAQLVVYRQLAEDYGQRFVALEGLPFVVRYSGQQAEFIRIGEWDRPVGNLPLRHAAIGSGSNIYQSLIDLKSLAYNPQTKILSGVFQSDSSYYMAAWVQRPDWRFLNAVRLGRELPAGYQDWGGIKARPLSDGECVGAVAYSLSEDDWQLAPAALTRRVTAYAAQWSLPAGVEKEKSFSSMGQKGGYAQGRILCPYSYKGSSGYFLADLKQPARSVYFAEAPAPAAFSKFTFVPLPKDWMINGFDLSDKGNIATLASFNGVVEYDAPGRKATVRKAPGKYPNLSTGNHYLLESTGLLLSNDDWVDRFTLQPVRRAGRGLAADSAGYDPVARRFLLHRTGGERGYVELRFDRLQLTTTAQAPLPLQGALRHDSTATFFHPAIGYWVHIGHDGISLDTGRRIYNNTVARLFRSDLNGRIDFVQLLPGNDDVVIGSISEGLYEHWSLRSERRNFQVFLQDAENFVLQAPSGYYYATPASVPAVGFERGGRGIPAQWVDAELNRPDRVLAELADTTTRDVAALLKIFRAATQKKAGLSLRSGAPGSPTLSLATDADSRSTAGRIQLDVQAAAGSTPLQRLRVYDNQVPVWDTSFATPQRAFSAKFPVELVTGDNQLVVVATDEGGNSSLPAFRRIVYAPEKPVPAHTILITVAVNRYADTARSLRFAVKDGSDLLAAFRAVDPAHTLTDSLFDEAVTPANLRALRSRLLQTGVEDRVVLSFSGHGMLDTSYNFYYATAPMDFGDPKKYGFSFAEMEGLLTGIPARRRLLLIDACNSGNVDREAAPATAAAPGVQEQHSLAPGSRGVLLPRPQGMSNAQVFSRLFSMSSGQSGAEIIAATAGNAYAYESEQWQNGVFTYSILQALRQAGSLDRNFDEGLSVRELKQFVYPLVQQLTGGRQQPLARFENAGYDWNLVPVPEEQ